MCAISCAIPYRSSFVPLQCLLLELYLILLPVFIWIHWGMGWFCFCFLVRNCSILKVLWEDIVRKNQPHTLRWKRNRVNKATLKWRWCCHTRGTALCILCLNLGMLKQGNITFGLVLSKLMTQRTICKDNKKAVIMTTRLMTTKLKIKNFL